MKKNRELKALITLAGKIDPSVQAAMLKASSMSARTSQNIQKSFSGMGSKLKSGLAGVLKGMGVGIAGLAVTAAAAFGAMGVQGLEYASDLNEVQNVVDTTFSQSAYVIDEFAESSLKAFGLSELQAKNYTGVLGTMLKSMGVAGDDVLVMSQNMAALAGDMASFNNLKPDEAFEKIRSGISGETEPLKQLGINMSVANLEAYRMAQGITTAFGDMSQADQALLRYNYLLSVTKDTQGDFAKTIDESFAGQQRLFTESLRATSGEIMQAMIPSLTECLKVLNEFLEGLDTDAIGAFVGQLGEMAVAFLPMVLDLLPSMGELLGMIVPPLMEIGQMLMPLIVEVVGLLMEALEPVLPIFMDIVKMILPPIATLLKAIMPLVSGLAQLFGGVLSVAINQLLTLLKPLLNILEPLGKILGGISGVIGQIFNGASVVSFGVDPATLGASAAASLKGYARGGLTSRPAIFGEAGPEMAIPIKPGSARSLGLLRRTAQLLGIGEQYNSESTSKYQFTYAPVIQGSDRESLEPLLKRQFHEMRDMIEDFMRRGERLAW